MRTTIVPAQITTVEDKVISGLNLIQLILLTIPVVLSGLIFSFLPVRMTLTPIYKLSLILTTFLFFGILALRLRGKLIIDWLILILRFKLRPRVYLYNKNSPYLRDYYPEIEVYTGTDQELSAESSSSSRLMSQTSGPNFQELLATDELASSIGARVIFNQNKKGELYAVVEKS